MVRRDDAVDALQELRRRARERRRRTKTQLPGAQVPAKVSDKVVKPLQKRPTGRPRPTEGSRDAKSKEEPRTSNGDNETRDEGSVPPPGGDIDDLFAGKKRKRATADTAAPPDNKNTLNRSGSGGRPPGRGSSRGQKTKTIDGLRVYTYKEIMNDNNLAELNGPCPFDCACCF